MSPLKVAVWSLVGAAAVVRLVVFGVRLYEVSRPPTVSSEAQGEETP